MHADDEFRAMARSAAQGDRTAQKVLADWLDEHDQPVLAHIYRHGVPTHAAGARGADVKHRYDSNYPALGTHEGPVANSEHPGVIFEDEPRQIRRLEGEGHRVIGAPLRPLAQTTLGSATLELFKAAPLSDPSGDGPGERYAIRYTLPIGERNLRIVAPVNHEHVRAIAESLDPYSWDAREWSARASRMIREEHEDRPVPLARIRLGEGKAGKTGLGTPVTEHDLLHEDGRRLGTVKVIDRGPMLHVEWVATTGGTNREGPEAMRGLHDALAETYPGAQYLTGMRISGFRGEKPERVVVPIRRRTKLARRPESADYDALVRGVADTNNEYAALPDAEKTGIDTTPRGVFADWLEEHGLPGAHVVRARAINGLSREEQNAAINAALGPSKTHTDFVTLEDIPQTLPTSKKPDILPTGAAAVAALTFGKPRAGVLLRVHHVNSTGQRVPSHVLARTAPELLALMADFPLAAKKALIEPHVASGALKRSLFGRGKGKLTFARMTYQAGGNGQIVNNQFYKGGQFVAKARQRIRDVAAKLVKLARPDEARYVALVRGVLAEPKDANARLVFADHLQDNGVPGAHVVRQHAQEAGEQMDQPRARAMAVASPRLTSPIVAMHHDGRVEQFGPNSQGDFPAFEKENAEAPMMQLFAHDGRPGKRGIAVITLHTTRGAEEPIGRLLHVGHARTADELRLLLSDVPDEAKHVLLDEWIADGTLRKRLSGKGSAKFKLARGDAQTSGTGLLGRGQPYDAPLTLGQLKQIEDDHELPMSRRLSPRVTQAAGRTGDEHAYSADLNDAITFLGHLSRSAIGPGKLKKLLADPKPDAEGPKHVHLMTQLLGDYKDAPHGEWYSGDINTLDRLLHQRYGWGKLDEWSGELLGKGAPHERHPELVLFKTIIGMTSPSQTPVDNLRAALGMWDEGLRRAREAGSDDPLAHIPPYQDRALKEWTRQLAKLHGREELPNPGTTLAERAKWYATWVAPKLDSIDAGKGKVGYKAEDAKVYLHPNPEHPHHGILFSSDEGQNPSAPAPSKTSAVLTGIRLPVVDDSGALRPKGWAYYGETAAVGLRKLKALVDRFRTSDGGTKAAYREAARVIFSHLPNGKTGAYAWGNKVGSFITNLHANDPATRLSHGKHFTHDTWMQRQLLRHLGRLTDEPGSKAVDAADRKQTRSVMHKLADELGITAAELQADLWYYEQGLLRRVGVPGHRIESLSYADAARKFLLSRPALHASLSDALCGKSWKRHSKQVAIQKHQDGAVSVLVHGRKVVTAHPDGTVKRWNPKVSKNVLATLVTKLARPIRVFQPGENAYQALDRLLGSRRSRSHGRTAFIERGSQGDEDLHVVLHGHRIVTAHPNGQVTLDHRGYKTPTTRRFMEGFSGHAVSFAGGKFLVNGEEYENGTRYPPAPAPQENHGTWTTIPHTDPELRSWIGQVRPDPRSTLLDHNAAGVLADWLEERGDWRHRLFRHSAEFGAGERRERFDSYRTLDGDTAYVPIDRHPEAGRAIKHEPEGRAGSYVYPVPDGRAVVTTRHPITDSRNGLVHSLLSADEYAALRRDAATAGVHFPELPHA